jgi:hypothetical protein
MKKIIPYLIIFLTPALLFWIYLLVFAGLYCKSLERFDNAKTRIVFPFFCEASINDSEYNS